MNRKKFTEGFEPQIVRIGGKPKVVGYIKDGVFRSVVKYSKHVLHKREGKPPAIAKETWVYRNIIRPKCQAWEVLDEERKSYYAPPPPTLTPTVRSGAGTTWCNSSWKSLTGR